MINFTPVDIEMAQIRQYLAASAGREVTEVEAMVWLRSEGFILYGNSWIGDEQSLRSLAEMQKKSECTSNQ